jgi:hypothetical protein
MTLLVRLSSLGQRQGMSAMRMTFSMILIPMDTKQRCLRGAAEYTIYMLTYMTLIHTFKSLEPLMVVM